MILAREFPNFHCLKNESNERDTRNTGGTKDSTKLARYTKVVDETETSAAENLTVLQVASAEESPHRDSKENFVKSFSIDSQQCLLSSNDEGSRGLEKFLRQKPNSL